MEIAVLVVGLAIVLLAGMFLPVVAPLIMVLAGGALFMASPTMSVGEGSPIRHQKIRRRLGLLGKLTAFAGIGILAAKLLLSAVGGWHSSDDGSGNLEAGRGGVYRSY